MLERYLIEHCAPTLASLKTANMFSYEYSCESELESTLKAWNQQLSSKGLFLIALKKKDNAASIYVFRSIMLQRDLLKPGVQQFLSRYGYESAEVSYAIDRLKLRFEQNQGFPHEIGIFLGYPLGDVVGFVVNSGQNCKLSGCWKVYCNENEAISTFAKFKKCRDVYIRLWKNGKSVLQLTVAV